MDNVSSVTETDADGYFGAYAYFSRTLRTWFVAYGVGGPVLILSNDKLADVFMRSQHASTITTLFLLGVAAPVVAATIYKGAMWRLYVGEKDPDGVRDRTYKIAEWLSDAYLLELLFDLVAIGLLGSASYMLLSLLRI